MNKKNKILLAASIVLLVALSTFVILFTVLQPRGPLDVHEPIIIWKDEDFNNYDFTGEGSEDNPITIQNYNITTDSRYGIYISNTTYYVVIRGCYIQAKTNGVHIEDVANSTIAILDNTCVKNDIGINIENSHFITIANNTCENNSISGINLSLSSFALIEMNNLNFNGEKGLGMWMTGNCTVNNNSCYGNEMIGLKLYYFDNSTISNNHIKNSEKGIYIIFSTHLNIYNNTISENTEGIVMENDVLHVVIWMNIFQGNEQYAIRLDQGLFGSAEEIYFHHNSVIDNNLAGTSQAFSLYATNYFYDLDLLEGNFWSDWISGNYAIDCVSALYDLYPLSESPHGIEV